MIIIFVDEIGKNSRKMHRPLLSQITEIMITVSSVSGLFSFFNVYKKTNFHKWESLAWILTLGSLYFVCAHALKEVFKGAAAKFILPRWCVHSLQGQDCDII